MSKGKAATKATGNKGSLAANEKAVDPALVSLFATSAGPVRILERKSKTPITIPSSIAPASAQSVEISKTNSSNLDSSAESDTEDVLEEQTQPPRKRRKVKNNDDLEAQYLDKLVREEQDELQARRKQQPSKVDGTRQTITQIGFEVDGAESDTSASNDLKDLSDVEEEDDDDGDDAVPLHESLTASNPDADQNRRTVFVSNVATSTIKSKTDRNKFLQHIKGQLMTKEKETVVSVRFRSTAFDVSAGPKRAAYAKKELMDETTRSTNAYIVLSSEAAARRVAAALNGSEILGRHIHVDSFANPMRTDNKRCVFVGNLPFVDEETAVQDSDGDENADKKPKRQKAKVPADAEEGLWRTFSTCGKVESVRMVRDRVTRVGKGFAYVQFEDGNGVEKALLLDGKKFPPLLPRLLRVSRAKGMKRKEVRAKESLRGKQVQKGRRREGDKFGAPSAGRGRLDGVVFEGYRASSDKKMKFKSKGKAKSTKEGTRPTSRSSKRGAAFKSSGGKKKRDAAK